MGRSSSIGSEGPSMRPVPPPPPFGVSRLSPTGWLRANCLRNGGLAWSGIRSPGGADVSLDVFHCRTAAAGLASRVWQ